MNTNAKTLAGTEDDRQTTAARVARRNEPAQDERLSAIRARAAGTVTSPLRQSRRDTPANEDALALIAYIAALEAAP